jgi:hypothetical protein
MAVLVVAVVVAVAVGVVVVAAPLEPEPLLQPSNAPPSPSMPPNSVRREHAPLEIAL